jgi:potassium channel subfamily K
MLSVIGGNQNEKRKQHNIDSNLENVDTYDDEGNVILAPLLNNVETVKEFLNQNYENLQTFLIVIVFYILCTVYYCLIEKHPATGEYWTIVDSVYFITLTICTVGYGDISPTNDQSRLITVFVILFGLIFVFGAINSFATYIISYAEAKAAKALKSKEVVDENSEAALQKKHFMSFLLSIISILFMVFVGTIFYFSNEDWTFIESFYFCIVTTTTVGYGDLNMIYQSSRMFSIFYIILSVVIVAAAIGNITTINFEIKTEKRRLENLNRKLDFSMIREMDKDGDGVDKCEFLVEMLLQSGLVDREHDIDPWLKRFEELDADGSGKLDKEDIDLLEEQEREKQESLSKKISDDKNNVSIFGSNNKIADKYDNSGGDSPSKVEWLEDF